jgi:hypothetical protein
MGMSVPFSARPFPRVRDALMGAPKNIGAIVLTAGNPLSRMVISLMLLRPHPELHEKVHVTRTLDEARALITRQRTATV